MEMQGLDFDKLKTTDLMILFVVEEDKYYLLTKGEFMEMDIFKSKRKKKNKGNYQLSKAERMIPEFFTEGVIRGGLFSGEFEVDESWVDGLLCAIPENLKKQAEEYVKVFVTEHNIKGKKLFIDDMLQFGLFDERFGIEYEQVEAVINSIPKELIEEMDKAANVYLKKNPSEYIRGEDIDW